jgi:hypothetical protein
VTRPRAADDFPAIRARLEELRRERARVMAESQPRATTGPRRYSAGHRPALADKRQPVSANPPRPDAGGHRLASFDLHLSQGRFSTLKGASLRDNPVRAAGQR